MNLQNELQQLINKAANMIPADKAQIMAEAKASLKSSGIVNQALKTGDQAPLFELQDARGEVIRSGQLLEQGPVVISFYRGSW